MCGLPGTGKTTLAKYLASQYDETKLLIYDPLDQYVGFPDSCRYIPASDTAAEFDSICRKLCARTDCVFVVEECERYIGQGRELGPHAFDLINRGRNWGIGIIAVTRRIQRLNKDFFDLCQSVFFFKCGLRSRNYIEDMIGRTWAEKIRELEPFNFLHYDLGTEKATISVLEIEKPKLIEKEATHKPPLTGGARIVDKGEAESTKEKDTHGK